MKKIYRNVVLMAALTVGLSLSSLSQAASVWAVNTDEPSSSNGPDSLLEIAAGVPTSIDIYFDFNEDITYGWDLQFDVVPGGEISNPSGENLGLSVITDGNLQLLSSDDVAITGLTGEFLVVTFDFIGDIGDSIVVSGLYTDEMFSDQAFSATTVATVVPIPAAVWLMGSALLGLFGVARRRKS